MTHVLSPHTEAGLRVVQRRCGCMGSGGVLGGHFGFFEMLGDCRFCNEIVGCRMGIDSWDFSGCRSGSQRIMQIYRNVDEDGCRVW
mmetsp:Transcript_34026/g.40732  ORF Transcript_34026/g.40732 Transcript_34026/m.40732 type:complete len:86 (+) Transcript_34026:156-413(+)